MATLLHDLDKPDPEHPLTATEKARRIPREYGFDEAQLDEMCFLIRPYLSINRLTR